ncbi:co-chaperone YbbN [Saccharobesus litoralis]|uniref:Co-chaperone YbbN n=1 Tax=Saccharobesus litoralis TaxID=2172099 RepID=A0A2S0VWQ1_9ALTE|nr:co-chaperone YbbN [Saccharobesus litoralis]AWB68615.1 co-chaperone YbbN [Saccharobesus litoralis]
MLPNEQSNIHDLTPENFQSILLEQSQTQLVLVFFWAQSIPESVELLPVVEHLAGQHLGKIILAKVDCESQRQIAMQFGVQAIPTLALVKEGQPIDGLAGQQTQAQVQEWLENHLPKPEDELLQQAQVLIAQEQYTQAYSPISQAIEIAPERVDIQKALIDVYVNTGKVAEAESLLSQIKMIDQDDYYQSLLAKLELAKEAADSPEIQALEQQIKDNPSDEMLPVKLAVALHQVQRNEEALAHLLGLMTRRLDAANGEARKILMDILQTLPDGDPLATKCRRRLYSLLY